MNPRSLFWIPVLMRLALIAAAIGIGWYFWGAAIGLLLGLLLVLSLAMVQLHYLYRLSLWLENPDTVRLADGFGAWTEIFARLYRLRREDERNRSDLAEWLSRFRQAMNLLPDGVVIMDDVLFLEWCNPVAEQHLRLNLEHDKGMRVTNLIRSPDFIDYIILGRYEQPLTLSLGERKLIVHLIPFENRRQILVTHDVTDAERLEQTRRDFIANASHELRTPLTVINGFLELATGDMEIDATTRTQHLKLMAEQGRRMQNLVEDMLSLTRLECWKKSVAMARPCPVGGTRSVLWLRLAISKAAAKNCIVRSVIWSPMRCGIRQRRAALSLSGATAKLVRNLWCGIMASVFGPSILFGSPNGFIAWIKDVRGPPRVPGLDWRSSSTF